MGVATCMFIYGAMKRQVKNVVLDAASGVHLLDTPMAIPRFAEQVMGQIGPLWLGIGFLFAGAATMAGVPRILYGMAVDGALPKVFTYLHPRFKTPVLCILVAMLIPCLHALYLGGNTDNIMHLVLAVCAWSFAYLLVTVSVVILRIRRPDLLTGLSLAVVPAAAVAVQRRHSVGHVVYHAARDEPGGYLCPVRRDAGRHCGVCAVLDPGGAEGQSIHAGVGGRRAGQGVCQ